jgi:hypothetical protein
LRLLSGAAAAVEDGAEEGFSALSFSVVDVVTTVARAPGAAVDGLTMGSSSESDRRPSSAFTRREPLEITTAAAERTMTPARVQSGRPSDPARVKFAQAENSL